MAAVVAAAIRPHSNTDERIVVTDVMAKRREDKPIGRPRIGVVKVLARSEYESNTQDTQLARSDEVSTAMVVDAKR